ncbi:hypothetical protein [Mameliella sediminis]|uniref:hypothetical protein n=1 Tax=Mameliella sediminis TaxID=2836866 RepID=UPI001C463022|nr:hypothetical protein [Mameliella sediminis]MBV7392813.1 hypothetical protein [Mameliella sediminis]
MPAVFNIAAIKLPLVQLLSMPQAAKNAAQKVPPGQAQHAAQSAPTAVAPNGAGAPMATGAVLPPSAQLPVPAPPPVVSTSQTGRLAAAAINGLERQPEDRRGQRQGQGQGDRHRHGDPAQGDDPEHPPQAQTASHDSLPGGLAPLSSDPQTTRAAPGYAAARAATRSGS